MAATDHSNTPPRISINLDDIKGHEGDSSPGGGTPKSSSGWDGKLRLEKKIELVNPEALSDPEYSDEEQVLAGETIEADEGTMLLLLVLHMAGICFTRSNTPSCQTPLQTYESFACAAHFINCAAVNFQSILS
jgi:hypothetical protein